MSAAIETLYAGHVFRSRLEARWAAFFDLLGWQWTYEPIDLAGYIPDFALHFDAGPMLVEVKPALDVAALRDFTGKIDASGYAGEVLLLGATPLNGPGFFGWDRLEFGLLGEWYPEDHKRWWEPAEWMGCNQCRKAGFFHPMGSFHSRTCGHADGDHLLGDPRENLGVLWAQAHAATRWLPRGRR